MPMESQAQRGAMFEAAAGKSSIGIPQSVGAKFVAHDQGGSLPKYTGQAARAQKRKAMAGARTPKPEFQ